MNQRTLNLKNSTVEYWFTDFDESKKTLLLVHGFRGTHRGLSRVAEHLTDKYNIIVPDLPGFGDSSSFKTGKANLDNYVDFLHDFTESLNLKTPPIIVAHSFGTIISSAFVAKCPNLADQKIVLICPIPSAPVHGFLKKVANVVISSGTKILPERLARAITGNRIVAEAVTLQMSTTKDKELKKYIRTEHRRHFNKFTTAKSMLEGLETSITRSVAEFAPDIDKTVLVIAGKLDNLAKLKNQEELVAKFMSPANLEIIHETGHLVHYETPKKAAEHISAFIS
jgi:pimeloyl-ACP methyl ester carboxylesterase